MAVLLFANYFFYARWDLYYLLLIPVVSTVDYCVGLGLMSAKGSGTRRFLLGISVFLNVGLLIFFKYVDWALESMAHALNWDAVPKWHWVLPISISFYVFQALTYTIDLYRKDAKGTCLLYTSDAADE